jgi:hypothetical protein
MSAEREARLAEIDKARLVAARASVYWTKDARALAAGVRALLAELEAAEKRLRQTVKDHTSAVRVAATYQQRLEAAEKALRAEERLTDRLVEASVLRETWLESPAATELVALHALTEIRCDHDAGTDVAICNCARWKSEPLATVQAAKEAWARHVLVALAGSAARTEADDSNS